MARVHQINSSAGGVPKTAVSEAMIDESGLEGDLQADKVHHGGPDQALCLFSLEVIQQLRDEGHPIDPGSSGENITVAGIEWPEVTPGRRMRLGNVEIEITHYASPCAKNSRWFKDGKFSRISQDRHPGEARVYARVLEGGPLKPGDPVELL